MNIEEIMLVDDDSATNYLSKIIIDGLNCCENISVFQLPDEALADIENRIKQEIKLPTIVFLDLNMPKLNGWEFLDQYQELNINNDQTKPHIVILTTSMNPEDEKRGSEIDSVSAFYKKPISEQLIKDVYQNYLQTS